MYVIVCTRAGDYDSQVFGPYETHERADLDKQVMEQMLSEGFWNVDIRELIPSPREQWIVCDNSLMDRLDK